MFFGTSTAGGVTACKARNFNQKSAAARAASDKGEWFDHSTSTLFIAGDPRNVLDAAKVSDAFIELHKPKEGEDVDDASDAAERLSVGHQDDLLKLFKNELLLAHIEETARLTLPGANVQAILKCGIVDTDKGKLKVYKTLLSASSPKSELLLGTLRGLKGGDNDAAKKVLREYLDASGLEGWILNPDPSLSNDDIRAVFRAKPILANWMHEMPGLADAIVLFLNGALKKYEFREILAISLFHNGPNAGYWKKVTEGFLPDDVFGAGTKALDRLLTGTVYEPAAVKSGVPTSAMATYPAPTTYLALVHVVLDRLSQGTKGGVHKIWHEIKAFTEPAKMVDDLLVVNQARSSSWRR